MITTTCGTWVNIEPHGAGTTPDSYVAESLGDYVADFDVDAMTGDFLAAINQRLEPQGLWMLGNGDLIAEVGRDYPSNPIEMARDAIEAVDFDAIMTAHDLTLNGEA